MGRLQRKGSLAVYILRKSSRAFIPGLLIKKEKMNMKYKVLPIMLVLALTLAACDLHISLPITQETGPTVTDTINVPVPADTTSPASLTLNFGAGKMTLNPGSDAWVSGTAAYNIPDFKPTITTEGTTATIEQGNWRVTGIPNVTNIKNEWNLTLGSLPMDLTIEAGAYTADYQFGGLALTGLTVKDGAAKVTLGFSSPNPVEMDQFTYETGASNVSLTGLGNANFTNLMLKSGAGNYTLEFNGDLSRDGTVTIQTGFSNLTLVIPEGIPARITVDGGLTNVSFGSGWTKATNVYTQEGSGPGLTVTVQVGAGNLTITH